MPTVRRAPARRRVAFVLLASVLALAGCDDDVIVPYREEPMLFLILHPQWAAYQPDVLEEYALFAETGSPTESRFISAEQFVMTAVADGVAFDWRQCSSGDAPVTPEGIDMRTANYCLAETGRDDLGGASGLTPGETYELRITAPSGVVRGEVIVPAAFAVTIVDGAGGTVAVWPDVAGAASYQVHVASGNTFLDEATQDTTFVIPAALSSGTVSVYALDENLTAYLRDVRLTSSGIVGANGVFGAVGRAEAAF